MPRDPGEVFQSSVDIDDEKKWRLKLATVVEVPSGFKDRRKDSVFLSWRFNVLNMDNGFAVIDEATGQPFELWHPSNDATFFNPDTKKMGGAREVGNMLMGRDLSDDDVRAMNADGIDGWARALEGKTAVADVEWRQTEKGFNRLYVLRLRPDPKGAQTRTVSAPAATTNGEVPETVAERRARVIKELEALDAEQGA